MRALSIIRQHLSFIAIFVMIAMLPSCASPQDQFGYAVMKGNTQSAQQFVAPRYARMTITESNGQKSVPIQYAIVQQNREMASFLLANDCHKSIGGNNLTYYSARNGYPEMAKYFASQGEGSFGDIERARQDRIRSNKNAEAGGLIMLGVLAALMMGSGGGGGGGGTCYNCGNQLTVQSRYGSENVCTSCKGAIHAASGGR